MAGKRQLRNQNYLKAVVIVHGQSEKLFAEYITNSLKFNGSVEYYGRGNGKLSIQFTGLINLLNSKHFEDINSFVNHYDKNRFNITGRGSDKKINDFKLYIIMDTDECLNNPALTPLKDSYLDKSMFKEHWLYDYIVPIYSVHDLEDVMVDIGLMKPKIKKEEKTVWYKEKMPILLKQKTKSDDAFVKIGYLRDACQKSKKTNLDDFITYCLNHIKRIK